MAKRSVLIIEDESDILDMIRLRLKKEGYDVFAADTGEAGLAVALERRPDLILLDLMLPIMNGFEVLKKIKAYRVIARTPVIIVSARGEESDIIVGLELGADDYVTKPFNMAVLVARINALHRRSISAEETTDHLIIIGPIQIDPQAHQVNLDGQPLSLTRTEFRILFELATSKGRVLTRNQLVERAMDDTYVSDRTVDVHLASLRNKLGQARRFIETVRGIGYRISSAD